MSSTAQPPAALWRMHGLLLRSILVVILASVVAGLAAVAYAAYSTSARAHKASRIHLNELLDTVESTLKVACFAKDETLAGELATGLLSNSDVLAVTISTEQTVLANRQRHTALAPESVAARMQLRRVIYSPFNPDKEVGHIVLVPDPQGINARIAEEVRLAALQLTWQLAMVAFAVAAIMLVFIVRPIKAISDRLHSMDPTVGERLPIPRRHAHTEIGQLVRDINQLSDRLVDTLAQEHELLRQRDIDEKKYHAIFDNAESGIFIVDSKGSVSSWNPAFSRLFDIVNSPAEGASASLHLGLLPIAAPDQATDLIATALRQNSSVAQDILIRLQAGQPRWVNIVLSPIGDNLLQGVVHDVTHLKESEASARRLVVTDTLTGQANRSGLLEYLQAQVQAFADSQIDGFALLLVNLDEFKRINEGMGLPAGDEILKTTTTRLASCIKVGDLVARLSADTFGLVLNGITQGDVAEQVAGRVLQAIRQTYFAESVPIQLKASVGITLFPNDGRDVPILLRQAELAMGSAKSGGGNSCVFFDPVLAESAERRRQLETDMRSALRNQEMVLFYQPVVDLQTHRLAGAEALIRWRHPARGLVGPDNFVALAEQTGLIVDIGLFVLDAACRQLRDWRQAGLDYTLSFNVSGRQIPDGLPPAKLREVIHHYGIDPAKLALEITEGVMLQDIDKSLAWLQAVHALGLRIHLDDFGTGYSSLSYLKRFPIDTLKIDQSFVKDMQGTGNERTLVGAILAMASSLGLEVVAEGVELPSHRQALRAMGCHYAQGFLFSRPVPAEQFASVAAQLALMLEVVAAEAPVERMLG
jgi:diguanylate cyclase (GGDEF)-like protein/PAS domain S-box-containing protein